MSFGIYTGHSNLYLKFPGTFVIIFLNFSQKLHIYQQKSKDIPKKFLFKFSIK